MEKEEKKIKSYCEKCRGDTHHVVKAMEVDKGENDYHCETYFLIVKCCGCDALSMRYEEHDFETYYQVDDDEWNYQKLINIYPPVLEEHDRLKNSYYIPEVVLSIYRECLGAFKAKSYILTGIGFRATVEAVCIDRGVTGKDLAAKIGNLAKAGALTKADANFLHSIRFLGNDAAHKVEAPTRRQLFAALRIIDHLLNTLYLVRNAAGELEGVVETYPDFVRLLKKAVDSNVGGWGMAALSSILGSSKRRIICEIAPFEANLIDEITSGAITWLKLGPVQHVSTKSGKLSIQTYGL